MHSTSPRAAAADAQQTNPLPSCFPPTPFTQIDIAVFEHDYPRLLQQLPAALAPHATYVRRPWPAADKVRLRALSHVWVDVFVLRRYESLDQVRQAVQLKDNGQPQPEQYIDAILGPIATADVGGAPRFPLWHYDCRKALEMWPSELFTQARLLLLRSCHTTNCRDLGGLFVSRIKGTSL